MNNFTVVLHYIKLQVVIEQLQWQRPLTCLVFVLSSKLEDELDFTEVDQISLEGSGTRLRRGFLVFLAACC